MLPYEYVVQKFYMYCGAVKRNQHIDTYQGSCAICREGSSWLKKRRCYYIVSDNVICCHNCGWFGKPMKWIQEVSNQTYHEILQEARTYDILPTDITGDVNAPVNVKTTDKLPLDCINLFDENQLNYHKDNTVVQKAIEVIHKRLLNVAVNKPASLWLSLTDKVHKNRLIIPFYNENGEIVFYQSRTLLPQTDRKLPKYLSKVNGDKSLFNMDKITADIDSIFIFEGPIDAFFVKNGTAVAGIQENSSNMFSSLQQLQIDSFKLHKRVWVLDSQWLDTASRTKTKRLIDLGETVFIWPNKIGSRFKDLNDVCIAANLTEVSTKFILDNSYSGLKAKLLMSEINS